MVNAVRVLKKRIQNITDEVKGLHPLLGVVFENMPSINNVEYTHGVYEKGADFVIARLSEEFGDTDYIGVLVKAGKITQSCKDVLDQIDQCNQRRLINNGKKEVYLSEIWVVVNGRISEGAKQRIYEDYKSNNVKFVDIERLSKWVEKYAPTFLENIPAMVGIFLANEAQGAVQREIKFSVLPTSEGECYFEQDIVKNVTTQTGRTKEERVEIFDQIEHGSVLTIEAPMGGGKSKLLYNIVKHYSSPVVYSDKKILPYYFSAQEIFKNEDFSFSGLVADIQEKYKLERDKSRRYLILVDGLDEVSDELTIESERFLNAVREVDALDNVTVVFASRFISDEDIEYELKSLGASYEIKPLTLQKVVKFIMQLCSSIKVENRLFEDLKKSSLFKSLPKTPIAAIVLAKLIREGTEEIPANLTELFSQYCELSLGRWDGDRGVKGLREYGALEAIIARFATYLLDNKKNSMTKDEVHDVFNGYLDERNLQLDSKELFEYLISRSEILVFDERLDDVSFRHRSFLEYFYGKALFNKSSVDITDKVFHPYWTNSYYFYVGLKKDCPELLSEIINLDLVEHEGAKLSRMINLGSFLLAGYKSPYVVIEEGIRKIVGELSDYYVDVSEQKITSGLDKLPKLHLLGLISMLVKESYSYPFFTKAIQGEVEELGSAPSCSRSDNDPYKLFFLATALEEVSGESAYNILEEGYGKDLPLPIQLLLTSPRGSISHKSTALRKLEKRVRKNAKNSRAFRAQIDSVASKSINGDVVYSSNGKKKISKKI